MLKYPNIRGIYIRFWPTLLIPVPNTLVVGVDQRIYAQHLATTLLVPVPNTLVVGVEQRIYAQHLATTILARLACVRHPWQGMQQNTGAALLAAAGRASLLGLLPQTAYT